MLKKKKLIKIFFVKVMVRLEGYAGIRYNRYKFQTWFRESFFGHSEKRRPQNCRPGTFIM